MTASRLRFSLPVRAYDCMTMFESPAHVGNLRGSVDFILSIGTSVYAAASGVIIDIKADTPNFNGNGVIDKESEGLGNFIEIQHEDDIVSEYEHLSPDPGGLVFYPKIGEKVNRGDFIGLSGATGWLAHLGPHLHFMVGRYNEQVEFVAEEIQWEGQL